jgi:hypothetical protein
VAPPEAGGGVEPVSLRLLECHFRAAPSAAATGERAGDAFAMELAMERPGALRLDVALTLAAAGGGPVVLRVTYGAELRMSPAVPEGEREAVWAEVAHVAAPALLYPYLRETCAALLSRAGAGGADLPLLPPPPVPPEERSPVPLPPRAA